MKRKQKSEIDKFNDSINHTVDSLSLEKQQQINAIRPIHMDTNKILIIILFVYQ